MLQNSTEKSDNTSLIRLCFDAADLWCCLGVAGTYSHQGAEATERVLGVSD